MAQRLISQAEEVVDKAMPAIREAMMNAIGRSGFGTVTIEIKGFQPTVEWANRDRTMQNGVPVPRFDHD